MEKTMIKILQVLDRASCSCPLGYISLHTNVIDPLEILEALEEEGYAQRCPVSDWSSSSYPMFEITTKARNELRELEANMLQIPLRIVAERIAND